MEAKNGSSTLNPPDFRERQAKGMLSLNPYMQK